MAYVGCACNDSDRVGIGSVECRGGSQQHLRQQRPHRLRTLVDHGQPRPTRHRLETLQRWEHESSHSERCRLRERRRTSFRRRQSRNRGGRGDVGSELDVGLRRRRISFQRRRVVRARDRRRNP